jgi:hypothetical protein
MGIDTRRSEPGFLGEQPRRVRNSQRLMERHAVPQNATHGTTEILGRQCRLDLGKRDVPIGRDDLQDRLSVPLDAVGASVAAQGPRAKVTLLAFPLAPATDACRAHAKVLSSLTVAQPGRHCCKNRTRGSTDSALDMSAGLRPGRQSESAFALIWESPAIQSARNPLEAPRFGIRLAKL